MHTTQVGKLYVIHNSDWSGDVFVGHESDTSYQLTLDGAEFLKLCARVVAVAVSSGDLPDEDIDALDYALGHS